MKCLALAVVAAGLAAQSVPPPTPPSSAPIQQPTQEPAPARLLEIKTVYLLKMARGMDQYLSHQLTKSKLIVVTSDPERADAIFTDRLGKDFEKEVAGLYRRETTADTAEREEEQGAFRGDKQPESTWGRGRGNVFLVDRVSGDVLWSHYAPSASSRSQDMQVTAAKIADRFGDDLDRLRNPSKKGLFGK